MGAWGGESWLGAAGLARRAVSSINILKWMGRWGGAVSHLPPLDLRLRGLAGTAGAAGLLLHNLDVGLLAGCRESGGGKVKHSRVANISI